MVIKSKWKKASSLFNESNSFGTDGQQRTHLAASWMHSHCAIQPTCHPKHEHERGKSIPNQTKCSIFKIFNYREAGICAAHWPLMSSPLSLQKAGEGWRRRVPSVSANSNASFDSCNDPPVTCHDNMISSEPRKFGKAVQWTLQTNHTFNELLLQRKLHKPKPPLLMCSECKSKLFHKPYVPHSPLMWSKFQAHI